MTNPPGPWDIIRAVLGYRSRRLKPAHRLLLLALLKHEGELGIFPSHVTLARNLGVHPSTIPALLARLREEGLVTWRHGAHSDHYTVHVARLLDSGRLPGLSMGDGSLSGNAGVTAETVPGNAGVTAETVPGNAGVNSGSLPGNAGSTPGKRGVHSRKTRDERALERTSDRAKKNGGASEARALVEHWRAEVLRVKGHEPVTEWAKDTKTFKRLLATMALEDAQQVVTDFLARPPRWYAERNLYEPEHVLQAANQLLARSRPTRPDTQGTGFHPADLERFQEHPLWPRFADAVMALPPEAGLRFETWARQQEAEPTQGKEPRCVTWP